MKKFILALLIVMLAVGSAYAVDVKVVKGSYFVKGQYWDNIYLQAEDTVDFTNYEHEMDFTLDWVVDESTKIVTRFEFGDVEPWGGPETQLDDNVELYYLYMEHKFPTNTVFYAGKMEAGTWATTFGDGEAPAYRLKAIQFFPWGLIVGLVQKIQENGYLTTLEDGEKDDSDAYALGAVFNAGPVKIMPLWFHIVLGGLALDENDDDLVLNYYALAATGNFGMISFEAEYNYWDGSWGDDFSALGFEDYGVGGLYAKVWANFDAFKVGGLFYWLDVDDDAGVGANSGTDLDETYIFGEELEGVLDALGYAAAGTTEGVSGWNCYQVFADFAFGKFSLNGSISFYTSNWDDDDSEAWEYNIGAAYAITDNVTYDIGFGMADIDADEAYGDDPDDVIYAFHRLKVSF